jgi:hypothetical protein
VREEIQGCLMQNRIYIGNIASWHGVRERFKMPFVFRNEPEFAFVSYHERLDSMTAHLLIIAKDPRDTSFLFANDVISDYDLFKDKPVPIKYEYKFDDHIDREIEQLPLDYRPMRGFLRVWIDQARGLINWGDEDLKAAEPVDFKKIVDEAKAKYAEIGLIKQKRWELKDGDIIELGGIEWPPKEPGKIIHLPPPIKRSPKTKKAPF